jgi:hypothetical protein
MGPEETIKAVKKLRELLSRYTRDVVDDPEEIEAEIACNSHDFVQALDNVLDVITH